MSQSKRDMERSIRTLRADEEQKHLETLNLCFGHWGDEAKWRKMYTQPGFEATKNILIIEENGEWTGGGSLWVRDAFLRNDKKTKVYVAGDLYTHPEHRGKGVYSTAMQNLNKMAKERGAALGIAFPSVFALPSAALPKYGFVETFRPVTWVLVLHPEKFFEQLLDEIRNVIVPKKLEGMKIRLLVSFRQPAKQTISKSFQVVHGRLRELEAIHENKGFDLRVQTDLKTLLKTTSDFYLKKTTFIPSLLLALITRRVRVGFSLRFTQAVLRRE